MPEENQENLTPDESLPEEQNVSSADGEGAVAETSADSGVADVLSKVLGKEFKDDEAALKAVKDTFSYVGKTQQELQEAKAELEKLGGDQTQAALKRVEELEKTIKVDKFFSSNPDYQPLQEVILAMGANPEEVVGSEAFKQVYETWQAGSEAQEAKKVLQSNPRLGQVKNKISEARKELQDAMDAGPGNDWRSEQQISEAQGKAVDAVLDAYRE